MIPCTLCLGSSFVGHDGTDRCPACWGHGILFKAEMVRAILDGRKSETRRLNMAWAKRRKGDRLWVRETWYCDHIFAGNYNLSLQDLPDKEACRAEWARMLYYRADGEIHSQMEVSEPGSAWRTPLHMPRWASRILLELTADARVEPIEAIDDAGARAEGFANRAEFLAAFQAMHAGVSLDTPVVVLPFRRVYPA